MAIRTNFAAQSLIDEEIDAEIRRHEQTMKALNHRRNIYCAINQLPADVLTSIFTAVQREARTSQSPYHVVFTKWIAISQVCQAWHDLVMNNPRFWSCIDLNSNQASRMLSLSKDSPLEVSCCTPSGASKRFWLLVAAIISQSGRLESLSMDFDDSDALPRVLSMIPSTSSAPQMQQLAIRASGQGGLHGNIWTDMPSLRELNITQGPLPSTTHSMPQLTHLTISSRIDDHQATASSLLNILKSSPHLQDVYIRGFNGPRVDPRSPRVSLPCLHILYFTTADYLTLSILNHLDAPRLTDLVFVYNGHDGTVITPTDISGLKALVSQVMGASAPIHKVEIYITNAFTLYVPDQSEGHHINCTLPLGFPEVLLRELCNLPPLHKASCLYLESMDSNNVAPQSLSFIPSYTDIETIVLCQPNAHLLQTLLTRDTEQHPPHPKLICLCLEYAHFGITEGHIFHLLMKILRERTRHMVPIKKVMIYNCYFLDTSLEELSRLVEVVHGRWEG
ncbi:hypothetical protein ONZ45_g10347 [Pleurotus djamor]|nr:hypothetical protein ONZ45_g10347 [Pleurotus djamor]